MADIKDATDTELEQFARTIKTEQERRRTLNTVPEQMDAMNAAYLAAEGLTTGDEWRQPTGAHDAYPRDWGVTHNGKTWVSLTPANVWAPGVSGWREVVDEDAGPAEWVAPTGAHDAYQTGDQVTYEGVTYESVIDSNTWSPADYPAGWKQL